MNTASASSVFDSFAPDVRRPVLPETDVSYAVEDTAVGRLLLGELERMAPQWPAADFDVEEQRGRLQAETA